MKLNLYLGKLKKVLFFIRKMKYVSILLLVPLFLLGCAAKEKNFEISTQQYDIKLINTEMIDNCIGLVEKDKCSIINLEIMGKSARRVFIALDKYYVTLNNGTQLDLYKEGIDLPSKCYNSSINGFPLSVGGEQGVSLCFPEIKKEDSPKLHLGIIYGGQEEYGKGIWVKGLGLRREHILDITPLLS